MERRDTEIEGNIVTTVAGIFLKEGDVLAKFVLEEEDGTEKVAVLLNGVYAPESLNCLLGVVLMIDEKGVIRVDEHGVVGSAYTVETTFKSQIVGQTYFVSFDRDWLRLMGVFGLGRDR